jgi:hypothetical protein
MKLAGNIRNEDLVRKHTLSTHVAEDRIHLQASVSTAMNLLVSKTQDIS